jgi:hypothetical protein
VIVEAHTFTADREEWFWDWLGDAYISSFDFSSFDESGASESSTGIEIRTVDGDKEVNEGDVIVKDDQGFRVLTHEQAEKELREFDKGSLS